APRGTGAAAAAAGLLAPTDTGAGAWRQVVDILAVFEPELRAGFDDLRADRRAVHGRGVQIPLRAVNVACPLAPALGLLEERQAVFPRPAAIAELGPMVVILGLAADVDEAIDRAGAAEHAAARIDDFALLIRLGLEPPGQGRMVEHLHKAGRDVDQRVPVAPARLDQQHLGVRILGQPVGEHAAGRAGADDDEIRLHLSTPSRRPKHSWAAA